jgi:hypothetical protein
MLIVKIQIPYQDGVEIGMLQKSQLI